MKRRRERPDLRLLDERGRLFGRINIVDLAVVVLVAFVVAGAGYKVAGVNRRVVGEPETVRLTLEINKVREYTTRVIQTGQTLLEHNSSLPVGTITAVEVSPAVELVNTADGRIVEAVVPGRYDVILTVEGQAMVTGQAISVAGQQVRVGAEMRVKTDRYLVLTRVIGIEVIR